MVAKGQLRTVGQKETSPIESRTKVVVYARRGRGADACHYHVDTYG